jgi:hypothetical protein
MRTSRIRQLTIAGALALVTASVAACGAGPQTPLPVQAASAEPAAAPSGSTTTLPSASTGTGTSPPATAGQPGVVKPTRTRTTTPRPDPTSESACFGAVRYDMDLQTTELELQKTMCFHTGGVLRLQGIGPGLVESGPTSVVSQSYAGGVEDLRFIRPGTATVTIPQEDKTHTITVVVRS